MLAEAASRSVTRVGRLWVDDFRCLRGIDLELDPGLTVIHGPNGQGKTSLLEAIAWIASAHSFRGVADGEYRGHDAAGGAGGAAGAGGRRAGGGPAAAGGAAGTGGGCRLRRPGGRGAARRGGLRGRGGA